MISMLVREYLCGKEVITKKCYSIGQANASSTQAVIHYCGNSLSRLRLRVARLFICIAEYHIGRIFH